MKIKQICICDSTEHTNTYYSFQAYVNEKLKQLELDEDVSDVKIEHYSPSFIVIGYYLEIDEKEG